MGQQSYMWSVSHQNVVMQHMTVHTLPAPDTKFITILCFFIFQIKDKQNDALISAHKQHTVELNMKHTFTRESSGWHASWRGTSCILWRLMLSLRLLLYGTPFSLVEEYQCFRKTFCLHTSGGWRQQAPLSFCALPRHDHLHVYVLLINLIPLFLYYFKLTNLQWQSLEIMIPL